MFRGWVVDCSVRLDAGAIARAQAAGAGGFVRYLWPDAWGPKGITVDEYELYKAARAPLAVVWESSAGRASEGYAAGVADAHTAGGLANAIGWPTDRPIYYADDQDTPWADAAGYYSGIANAGVLRPRGGIYAGVPNIVAALDAGLCGWGWVAAASSWSHGETTDLAALWQQVGEPLGDLGFGYDANIITLADWGQHPAPAPTPPPLSKGAAMLELTTAAGQTFLFWTDAGHLYYRGFDAGTPGAIVTLSDAASITDPLLVGGDTAYGPVVYGASNDGRTLRARVSPTPPHWGMIAEIV